MVDELGELRKYTTRELYQALAPYADPEYAALSAWYVLHHKPPIRRIEWIYKPTKISANISKRLIDMILNNYQKIRLGGSPMSLLPELGRIPAPQPPQHTTNAV
jgi:hypothetical protein